MVPMPTQIDLALQIPKDLAAAIGRISLTVNTARVLTFLLYEGLKHGGHGVSPRQISEKQFFALADAEAQNLVLKLAEGRLRHDPSILGQLKTTLSLAQEARREWNEVIHHAVMVDHLGRWRVIPTTGEKRRRPVRGYMAHLEKVEGNCDQVCRALAELYNAMTRELGWAAPNRG